MRKYLKAEYLTNGKLATLQQRLAEYAASDKWGSTRSCMGCLLFFVGLFFFPVGPVVGLFIFFYYSRYDTEDRRYQLPAQLLEALASRLDPQKEMLMRVDFRESKAEPFITAKRDGNPKVTEYSHNWLELQMYTPRGQRLAVKITRQGKEVIQGSGKGQTTEHSFVDVAALSLENFDRGSTQAVALSVPDTGKFSRLVAGTTGAAIAIEGVGAASGPGGNGIGFDGSDLATLFDFALKQ
ncbi:hypothetical protein JST97_15420 [bacterium]|nr:hypothetical protein [bacterium]